jgi:hypothetical protein
MDYSVFIFVLHYFVQQEISKNLSPCPERCANLYITTLQSHTLSSAATGSSEMLLQPMCWIGIGRLKFTLFSHVSPKGTVLVISSSSELVEEEEETE